MAAATAISIATVVWTVGEAWRASRRFWRDG